MRISELREVTRSRWNELCPDQRREIRAYVICCEIKHIRREIHKGGSRIRRAINPEETLQTEIGRIKAAVINSQYRIRYAILNAMNAKSPIVYEDSGPELD